MYCGAVDLFCLFEFDSSPHGPELGPWRAAIVHKPVRTYGAVRSSVVRFSVGHGLDGGVACGERFTAERAEE